MQKPFLVALALAAFALTAAAQNAGQNSGQAAPQNPPANPAAAAPAAPENPNFKTPQEKTGYAIGMQLGAGMHKQGLEIDPASFAKGFADAYSGGKMLMTEDEMHTVLTAAQQQFRAKLEAERDAASQKTLKEGQAYLDANKAKDGVITTASGLQYKILKAGDGPKPSENDTVVCNYRGAFIDGTEFDSSAKHDGPATFPVKGVIPGWTEALQLMPVGSKWQLVLPPSLAYGDRGAGEAIPPNSTLVFEVELVSIKPPEKSDDKPSSSPSPTTAPKDTDKPQQ